MKKISNEMLFTVFVDLIQFGAMNDEIYDMYDDIIDRVKESLQDDYFREYIGEDMAKLYDELIMEVV